VAVLFAAAPLSSRATQETGLSQAAKDAGESYLRALGSAGIAYANHDFSKALDKLDVADQIAPNIPDTWMMRGAIYAEQRAFDKAQDSFEKAGKLNPGDFWPQYNLAELLLMQKKFGAAATAFQRLQVYATNQELVQFKVVFTNLMAGNPDAAKPALDAMKFPSETAAYYFAQAAWAFAHQNSKDGNYWTRTGLKVFGLPRALSFYDQLAQVGWVPMRNADGSVPASNDLTSLPGPTPGVDLLPGAGGTP